MQIEPTMALQQPSQADTPTNKETVQSVTLSEVANSPAQGPALLGPNLQLIQGVKVRLAASLGQSELTVGELFSLKEGSVVKLDRLTADPVDILLDGKVVARGQLVVVDDNFGISITQIPQQG
jgi:flagellar motor switch protein FliN/FliY